MLDLIAEPIVRAALQEDLGLAGDVTSLATVPKDQQMRVDLNARTAGTISGLVCARLAFQLVDPTLTIKAHVQDGDTVPAKTALLTVEGSAQSILTAERVALNFMGHLSGIATTTADMVARIKGTQTRIVCTRKTTPNLRAVEKQAVVHGGGFNHRFRLDDAILIKDNHIAASNGCINTVLDRANAYAAHMTKIEIEVDTLEQLDTVIAHGGADNVLLDNMSLDDLRDAVQRVDGTMATEASGNVRPDTVADIAQTGVDYISAGWLTHSSRTLDIGLDVA